MITPEPAPLPCTVRPRCVAVVVNSMATTDACAFSTTLRTSPLDDVSAVVTAAGGVLVAAVVGGSRNQAPPIRPAASAPASAPPTAPRTHPPRDAGEGVAGGFGGAGGTGGIGGGGSIDEGGPSGVVGGPAGGVVQTP